MSNAPLSPPKPNSPLATGVLVLTLFVGACSIAAGHSALGGIFPFAALAAALVIGASLASLVQR